jgi:hypothetical protein
MKPCFFLISLILVINHALAQDQVEGSAFYGFKVHTPDRRLDGHTFGAELAYNFDMSNNKADYIRLLNIRSIDLAASYRNFDRVSIRSLPDKPVGLGDAYSIFGRLDIGVLKLGKLQLLLAPAFGFSYATQTFFTGGNPLIGSHLNMGAQIGLKLFTPLSKTMALKTGVDIFHFSNAAFFTPNYGINSNCVSLSLVKILPTCCDPQ